MKIIIDKHIPFIKGALEPFAEVEYYGGKEINREIVKDADALIIRTRTKCDAALLEGTKVRFIASATIGYDHIDVEYCKNNGITWRNAPGCNADSVAQYVGGVIALWAKKNGITDLRGKVIGVVGVGNVGSKIVELGKMLGMRVMMNDIKPYPTELGGGAWDSIEDIAAQSDIISFHTPLTHEGENPSYHLCNERTFHMMMKKPLLINAARGGVVDETALKMAIDKGIVSFVALDCWEKEPNIDLKLLEMVDIATPHIAGYSADGKMNGTKMSIASLIDFFAKEIDTQSVVLDKELEEKAIIKCSHESIINELQLSYDVRTDSDALKASASDFELLRGEYPIRRERILIY